MLITFDCQLGPLQRRVISTYERYSSASRIDTLLDDLDINFFISLNYLYFTLPNLSSELGRISPNQHYVRFYNLSAISTVGIGNCVTLWGYFLPYLLPGAFASLTGAFPSWLGSSWARGISEFFSCAISMISHLPTVLSLIFHPHRALWTANTNDFNLKMLAVR